MHSSIRTQIIVVSFVLLILMSVLSLFLISRAKRSQTDSAGLDMAFLADRILVEIDKHVNYYTEELQLYTRRDYVRRGVEISNRTFDTIPDVTSFISLREEEIIASVSGPPPLFSTEIVTNEFTKEVSDDLIEYLSDIQGYPSFLRITVINKYGAAIASTSRLAKYDFAEDDLCVAARDNGFSVSSVLFDEALKRYVVYITVRIEDEQGNYIGALRGALDIRGIAHTMELGASRYETMQLKLLTPDGKIISSTPPFVPFEDISNSPLFKNMEKDRGFFTLKDGVRDRLISYSRKSSGGISNDLNLILAEEADLDEVLQPVRSLAKKMFYFTLVILLVGTAVSFFASYYVTRPSKESASFTRETNVRTIGEHVDDTATGLKGKIGSLGSFFDRIVRDLTQSQETLIELEKLREREETAALMLNAITESAFLLNREGFVVLANDTICRRLGVTHEKFVGSSFYDFLPRQVGKTRWANIERVFNSGEPVTFEDRRSGRTILNSIYPIADKGGIVENVVVFGYDITELRRAQEELRRAGIYNRSLIEASIDPLVTIGPDGRITDVNHATEETTGYTRDELIGTDFLNYFTDPERARTGYLQVFREGSVRDYGLEIRHKDGTVTPVHYNATVYRDESGEVIGVFAAARDVTELKRIEQDLRLINGKLMERTTELTRSNRDLEQFAYVTSHDLQEPLRAISSFSQLLAQRYRAKLDKDGEEFIDYVVNGSVRMQQLINDLLAFSRVSTRGKEFEPTDVNSILSRAIDNLSTAVEESNAVITKNEMPTLMADGNQLAQVFQNLIGNAIKFRGKRTPMIDISATSKDGQWVFSVRDNGIGIEPQYFEKIFVIFQRLHGKEEYSGTGSGLAICKIVIERHGGRIWVESEPNSGSTFYFTLPIQGEMNNGTF